MVYGQNFNGGIGGGGMGSGGTAGGGTAGGGSGHGGGHGGGHSHWMSYMRFLRAFNGSCTATDAIRYWDTINPERQGHLLAMVNFPGNTTLTSQLFWSKLPTATQRALTNFASTTTDAHLRNFTTIINLSSCLSRNLIEANLTAVLRQELNDLVNATYLGRKDIIFGAVTSIHESESRAAEMANNPNATGSFFGWGGHGSMGCGGGMNNGGSSGNKRI